MWKINNPFTPTFGMTPLVLAGREYFIDEFISGLENAPGDPNRSTILVGPRGSGKTALMKTIELEAKQLGWACVSVTTRETMLDEILYSLEFRSGLAERESPLASVTAVSLGPVGVEREIPHREVPMRFRLENQIDHINKLGHGVLFIIDEVDPQFESLINFVSDYQMFVTDNRNVALLMAGLPGKVSDLFVSDIASFIRRSQQRTLGLIDGEATQQVLQITMQENGRDITPEGLQVACEITQGYPYAIQLLGYHLWKDVKTDSDYTKEDVLSMESWVKDSMERSVFRPTLQELTVREEEYLRAMVLDEGPSTTSEIAKRMGISMTNASNIRRRLIAQGMIREVRMGLVDFDMPLLREHLQSLL